MQLHHEQRRVWAEIDLEALEHNYRCIRKHLPDGVKLCCVIKANAYGHGAPAVAKLYEQLGAELLAVSNIEEAIQLRRAEVGAPVLILGYTPAPCVCELAEQDLTQCVYSLEYARLLSDCAVRAGVTLDVHLKLDTGMGRIGFCLGDDAQENERTLAAIEQVCRLPALRIRGAFTHFSVADDGEAGEQYSRRQHELFLWAVRELESRGIRFAIRHCSNSAALLDYPEFSLDAVRAGVVLYGLYPSEAVRSRLDLRPAMTLKSVVSHIKQVKAGDSISYGRTFVAPDQMRIATIPIGYADGYRRAYAEHGAFLLIRGKRAPVVGRVCMDQLMVDISGVDGVCVGDEVIVFGSGGALTAHDLALLDATVDYEVICSVGVRVPRVYRRGSAIVHIQDQLLS